MKKWISLMLAAVMIFGCAALFSSCGEKKDTGDLDYIKEKGKLVVAVTDFAPMDYKDENGEWIGFDADLAKEFGKYIGVEVEFAEIEWKNKIFELDSKSIDCAWNGMTLTDEVKSSMACSKAYFNNQQVVILPKDKADKYTTIESMKALNFAVEGGSAGKEAAEANGFKFTELNAQSDTLKEVAAGTSDAAIIDYLMAVSTIGEGTSYANLVTSIGLTDEVYGVGFRKGSDVVDEFNKFLDEKIADGTAEKIATKYKIQDKLIK